MLLALIAAQLVGIQNDTTKMNARARYGQSSKPNTEELAVLVLMLYILIGMFIWPVSTAVTLFATGHKIWGTLFSAISIIFAIIAFPIYLIFGAVWSTAKFFWFYT